VIDGREVQFEGIVNGQILEEKRGKTGFGYDPIFQPEESDLSFAEMPLEEKNKISHRGRAVQKLVEYLSQFSSE
jgi:XTP/dITP diphosphohydrolase